MEVDSTQTITVRSIPDIKMKDFVFTGLLILIPLIWSGPQLLIGSVVNMLLFLASSQSRPSSWYVKAALPSLAVIIHGVLFSSFTIYLFYLWPIITIGNWMYMGIGQSNLKINKVTKLLLAAIIKTSILILGVIIMVHYKIIPSVMVNSMGTIQFVTAMIGGLSAILWIKI